MKAPKGKGLQNGTGGLLTQHFLDFVSLVQNGNLRLMGLCFLFRHHGIRNDDDDISHLNKAGGSSV